MNTTQKEKLSMSLLKMNAHLRRFFWSLTVLSLLLQWVHPRLPGNYGEELFPGVLPTLESVIIQSQ